MWNTENVLTNMDYSYIILTGPALHLTHKIDGHPSDWNRQDAAAASIISHIDAHCIFIPLVTFCFLLSDFYVSNCLEFSHKEPLSSNIGSQMWPFISKLIDIRYLVWGWEELLMFLSLGGWAEKVLLTVPNMTGFVVTPVPFLFYFRVQLNTWSAKYNLCKQWFGSQDQLVIFLELITCSS